MNINNLLNLKILTKQVKNNYISLLSEMSKPIQEEIKFDFSLIDENLLTDIKSAIETCHKSINLDINNPLQLDITDKRENDNQVEILDLNKKVYYAKISEIHKCKIMSSLKNKKASCINNKEELDLYFNQLLSYSLNKLDFSEENKEYKSKREMELREVLNSSIIKLNEIIKIEVNNNYNKEVWSAGLNSLNIVKDRLEIKDRLENKNNLGV